MKRMNNICILLQWKNNNLKKVDIVKHFVQEYCSTCDIMYDYHEYAREKKLFSLRHFPQTFSII